MITITRRYHWEAAHWLPGVPDTHKCRRVHGHNYEAEITVQGEPDKRGFIMDFSELDEIVNPIVSRIDHRLLNDIQGLQNPTAEFIAKWLLDEIRYVKSKPLVLVTRVRVYETKDCWAEVNL